LHGGGQGFESPRLHSKNCSLILRSRIHRRLLRVVMPGTGWPKRWPPSPSGSGRSSVRTGFDGRPQCLTTIGKSLKRAARTAGGAETGRTGRLGAQVINLASLRSDGYKRRMSQVRGLPSMPSRTAECKGGGKRRAGVAPAPIQKQKAPGVETRP
jgi:hypothetical protein